MTQGLFINGRRPKSKKEVREFINETYLRPFIKNPDPDDCGLEALHIEATSVFGNEFDGPLSDNRLDNPITFVGPDPYNSRKFYGQIKFSTKKGRWIVS